MTGRERVRQAATAVRGWVRRRWATRGGRIRVGLFVLVLALLSPAAVSAVTYEPVDLERGTIQDPANGTTVIAVQGFKLSGQDSGKKPARLVGVGPEGETLWEHGTDGAINWFYDVDPLDDGTLLVVGANRSGTVVTKYDPERDEHVWTEHFDIHDTHDVDLINGDQLLVANMRNYNATAERNDDRLFVYDRGTDTVVWEWYFRSHYDRSAGGDYTDDWTHVNDVDKIGPGEYLASPRNMDEVVVVNRSTNDVTMTLGEDENHSVLYEQHNPQYLTGEDGTPTMLVADSENDRVVEYAKSGDGWERTWTLGSSESFNWPRDADRLPNGNTLVTDSLNHRVMEVSPTGEVVWEYYAPWGTYEAERVRLGDEPGGPTIRQQGATGEYDLWGSATLASGTGGATFAHWLSDAFAGTPLSTQVDWAASRWAHIVPWVRPVWMRPWDFVAVVTAGLVTVGWTGGELLVRRRAIRRRLGRAVGRLLGHDAPGADDEARDADAGDAADAARSED
jgi:hypothetical protein